jgi:redox-regulated HSP33 family molecular chaperone
VIASAPAIEPATLMLPVKTKLSTKVSTLPVTLQLTALTIEREWESRTRMSISSSRFPFARNARASRDAVSSMLKSFAPKDRAEVVRDDRVVVNCEFCSSVYEFTPQEVGVK